jgi:transcriptional regulator with XRE-family HTH domain
MNESHQIIGPLMKAARKFKKYNQAEVAKAIGCSQSALSKMEHNLLIPNAPQWFLFSRFTSIPPESLETGIIDRNLIVRLNDDKISLGYKLPKRYRLNRAEKVREVYPFLSYLEKKIDGEVFQQFMADVGIDPEFFIDFDNLINFQLIVDLINTFMKMGRNQDYHIQEIIDFGVNSVYWNYYETIWSKMNSIKELLVSYCLEQSHFQGDFKLKVEEKSDHFLLSFRPEPHLYHILKDITPNLTLWINTYRRLFLLKMLKTFVQQDVEIKIPQEEIGPPLEGKFQIF